MICGARGRMDGALGGAVATPQERSSRVNGNSLRGGGEILDRAVRRRATSLALNQGNGAVSQTFVL